MVTGANQKRAKRTKSKRTQKVVADAAKIAEKKRWRLIKFDKESFRRRHALREKRHLCFNLRKGSRKATLLEIFLKFLPYDFVTRIANDIPDMDLKYYNGWCLRLSTRKIYSMLALKIRIYGGQQLPVGVKARSRPLRCQIQQFKQHFEEK